MPPPNDVIIRPGTGQISDASDSTYLGDGTADAHIVSLHACITKCSPLREGTPQLILNQKQTTFLASFRS